MMRKHGFSSSDIGKNSQKHVNVKTMIQRLVNILGKIGLHAMFLLACTIFAWMLLSFVLTLMGVLDGE